MSVIELDFYDGDDPNGALLGTLTDTECTAISLRVALRGLGGGSFSISQSHPSASGTLIRKGNYVRTRIPSIQAEAVWGFWLWEGKFNLLDTQGDDTLTFSGPGPLGILRDAILHSDIFAPGQPRRGNQELEGYWAWNDVAYGGILVRIIEEGQNQTGTPLSPVTIDFDRVVDSAASPWPIIDNFYQQPIGSNTLRVFESLRSAGDLLVFSDTDFLVQAFQTFGTDRTSLTFAAGKVRLTETNILTGLSRHIHATNELTHDLLRDLDGAYSSEVHPDYAAGRARWGFTEVDESNDPTFVGKVGQRALIASSQNTDAFELEVTPGDDELNGRYLPWTHYNVGDTATVDAGTGLFAYEDADAQIVAFRVELDEASDDTTDDLAHRSLRTVIEFNAALSESGPIESQGGGPGCLCLKLCRGENIATLGRTTSGTVQANSMVWDDPATPSFATAQTARVLCRWENPTGAQDRSLIEFDLQGADAASNYALIKPVGETCDIFWNADEFDPLDLTGIDLTQWTWFLLESHPDYIQAKVWQDGDEEPTAWGARAERPLGNTDDITGGRFYRFHNNWAISTGSWLWHFGYLAVSEYTTPADNFARRETSGWGTSTAGIPWDWTLDTIGVAYILSGVGCVHGGPAANSGDATEDCGKTAAPCNHQHDYVAAGGTTGQALVKASNADWDTAWSSPAAAAPTTADYLVGTAQAGLSAEIVTGTTPQGELGGTWGSPTVDSTHAGSNHNQPVRKNSTGSVFERRRLNFIEGTNVTLTVADDGGNDEVDITIASTGGGSGIAVEEDGTEEGASIDRLDFTTGLNVSVSGSQATISADAGGTARQISRTQSIIQEECFFQGNGAAGYSGGFTQFISGAGTAVAHVTGEANHPGIISFNVGTTTTGRAAFAQNSSLASMLLGGGEVAYGIVAKIDTLSDGTDTYSMRLGLGDSVAGEFTDGVFFRYTHSVNSGKWEIVARSNGTETAADSGITADTNWHSFECEINAAATSAEFFIDGASVGTVGSNFPTGTGRELEGIAGAMVKSAGTASRTFKIDAYWYHLDFTTPR